MPTPKRGLFVVFEGPDGVGKSTLAAEVADRLTRETDKRCLTSSFPGRRPGTLGELVYKLHHDAPAVGVQQEPTETALQTLHVAAHADAIEAWIRPMLDGGNHLALDRYWWSTWAYGLAGGIGRPTLEALIELERRCWGDLLPDVVVLVDRETPWREELSRAEWAAVRREYLQLAAREADHHPVITCTNQDRPDVVADRLTRQILDEIGARFAD